VFGGGQRLEGPAEASAGWGFNLADAANSASHGLFQAASFQRRHQEWKQAMDQSTLELAQIEAQLEVWKAQNKATTLQVSMARTSLDQARKTYDFLTSSDRFSKSQTYDWLVGQLGGFYFNAYSSALSLCRSAEACWRYEQADYHRASAFTGAAWNSSYRGLGAGESLKQGLVALQTDRLLRDERELEIVKTVALSQLKDKDPLSTINKTWKQFLKDLKDSNTCEFEVTQAMLDADFPGQYRRRIKSISLSVPATMGPYQDIRVLLSQTSSRVEMAATPGNVKDNLRTSQQIAVSNGVDDHGMFMLDFRDERYLPFEGTGVVSKWLLTFSPNQSDIIEALNDIILHVRYTAVS
jgi:hypothetical protein